MKISTILMLGSLIIGFIGGNLVMGSTQSAAAKGVLTCNDEPAVGVIVKLYDHDRTDPSDLLEEGITDEQGQFYLSGYEFEFTTIGNDLLSFYKYAKTFIKVSSISTNLP